MKNMTAPEERIMTGSYPYIRYLAQRETIQFPEKSSEMPDLIKGKNITYFLVYKFEPGNPEWIYNYFASEKFEKIKTFEQWGDSEAAVIYRLKIANTIS